jgi:hypothetical protein
VADGPSSPGPGLGPQAVVRWWAGLLRELSYAPVTVARARHLLDRSSGLPFQLERVADSVERTTAPLSTSLDDVAAGLADIRDRLEHLDLVISHLRDTLTAVIAAVPGARRALDRLPQPPRPAAPTRADRGTGPAEPATVTTPSTER